MYDLGLVLLAKGNLQDAQQWLRRAADAGADAAEALDIVERRLLDAEAEKMYRPKAEQGDAHAAFQLAVALARQGSEDEAESWYCKAPASAIRML